MRVGTALPVVLATVVGLAAANPAPHVVMYKRQDCQPNYSSCAPDGATATALPPVGTALASLYNNLLDAAKNAPAAPTGSSDQKRDLLKRDPPSMCCAEGSACLNIASYNVPMCYDHFTTNFILPDGSYGTLDSGAYHAADGSGAFLGNGSFSTKGGQPTANLYGAASNAPNTATLPIPTPYTGTGIGSAIPVTALGGLATFTVTIPGTTIAATTETGAPGTTIAATTIPPEVTTFTSAIGGSSTSKGGAPAPTHFAAAAGAAGAFVAALAAL